MSEAKNVGGRPPKYTSKDEIVEKINAYFERCDGKPLTNQDDEVIYDKWGYPVIVDRHPPTVTGLALALGFATRQSLLNYQGRKEFRDVITRAKSRIEQYTEERLFDKDGANGAKFSLQNNFKGWNESAKEAASAAASAVKIICDIPKAPTQTPADSTDADNGESE